jgi:hypothetical protein
MKKLTLEISDLRVDSFGTVAEPDTSRGTVAAAGATALKCTQRDCTCTCGGADPRQVVNDAITCFCCA